MDGLCLKTGIHGVAPSISVNGSPEFRAGIHGVAPSISLNGSPEFRANVSQVNAVGRSCYDDRLPKKTSIAFSRFSFKHPMKSLWLGHGGNSRYNEMALDDAVSIVSEEETEVISPEEDSAGTDSDGRNGSWVLKIMDVRSLWREEKEGNAGKINGCELEENSDDEKDCENCRVFDNEEDDNVEFDRTSFSRLLRRASLAEARLYARMSYLGKLAYRIPKIQPGNLLENLGLRFITSSLEKREMAGESRGGEIESDSEEKPENAKNDSIQKSLSTAYDVTASAASYLHSQTRSLLPYKFTKDETSENSSARERQGNEDFMSSDMASLMATTESVTAVVAAKEEVKQAVADNLKSSCSSPCEWFICDDDRSGTRFFVVQGSESLASWQANLLFEPIQFEGLDVVVHRGIYEAAKGIYEQMLPEVHAHLKSRGTRATFRFTGHSLGGSLALLINLMLLIRLEAPISSLLPVITFGAPCIMCGGDVLLRKLGLPRSHVQAVALHRDIVPRAFSCKYPSHVAKLLKALNGNFRNHRCLNSQKLLYVPMGELLILQPDENFSPNHHLLPPGNGLYILDCPLSETSNAEKLLQAAKMVFLNSPHPLEILSDRSAYGSEGTIQRDHDMELYSKSIREVIRQELRLIKKAKREHWLRVFRQTLARQSNTKSIIDPGSGEKFNFSGVVQRGRESLKRFSRLVASQHMHLFVVLLCPARLLILGEFSSIV